MTGVGRIGGGTGTTRRATRPGGGFALPATGAAAAAATPGIGLAGLLAIAEAPAPPTESVAAAARRRAGQTLEELRGLQLDLLRGSADSERLQRLAALAGTDLEGLDPALREAARAIALRARLELARRRVALLSAG